MQRPRQEGCIDPASQCSHDCVSVKTRGNGECNEPVDRVAVAVVGRYEYAVQDAIDRIQLVVQIRQRRTLAGNIDEIGNPALRPARRRRRARAAA